MDKFDLVKRIEIFAPPETQEQWDCSGWSVCTDKQQVNKVMLALTVTDNIVKQAKEKKCDMLISHHPLFFVPLKYSDIDIYCAHTNMDKARGGTTDTLIDTLGFKNYESLNDFVRVVTLDNPVSVQEIKSKLQKISPNLRYVNNNNTALIKTIAFCAGSGSEFVSELNADAFVTGDLKFHTALEANIVIFDIGHFESEIMILNKFKEILDTEVCFAEEQSPFKY